ncbi:hypothetical protein QBC34DRAFT_447896 [Podospora aff. communis PSN243]|uniref:Clr5 domain-containing protein n=1 Tax=Podospora aff. communis PSN243 TaxID=3040156 RepID=A0AAV9GSH7_9PEZI|nr:hypothetical protein QBC34DRAFT_447896 [Podospora aff. communis PSN243]
MEREHSFQASQKAYKEQFDVWGWKKKLPKEVAQFMTEKAKKRKREAQKETLFSYGGKKWTRARAEKSVSRSKSGQDPAELHYFNTPEGVTYATPPGASPLLQGEPSGDVSGDATSPTDSFSDAASIADTSSESSKESEVPEIRLSFEGKSRQDLLDKWTFPKVHPNEIPEGSKERMLNLVLDRLTQLQGATNEETSKVAYALADHYIKTGENARADGILERHTRAHIRTLGYGHKKTRQHILHVVELLNGWGRHEDALGMLSKAKEIHASVSRKDNPIISGRRTKSATRRDKDNEKTAQPGVGGDTGTSLSGVVDLVSNKPTRATIDLALSMTRPTVRANDAAAEGVLLAIIRACRRSGQLATEHLRATADLLGFYRKWQTDDVHIDAYLQAQTTVSAILSEHIVWDLESFHGFEVIEAALEVVSCLVRCGYKTQARVLFHKIQDVGIQVFGSSDERMVWTLISIGLVYQTHCSWAEAREWFEAAFAAVLTPGWDHKDGIVQSLQRALERQHFAYITDEGRPFRTVFGVNGLTIMPLRLHME